MKFRSFVAIFLTISLSVIGTFLSAQSWMKQVKTNTPNFFEIQKAFNDYHASEVAEKKMNNVGFEEANERDDYYSKFKRWEYYWETRVDANGNFPPSDIFLNEYKKYNSRNQFRENNSMASANWSFTGPSSFPLFGTQSGGIGRVNCIAFHPTLENTFWIGTPDGGLWKTTDGGLTWATTDNMPVIGVSDIAIDYSNPNIIYIATGDGETALITPSSVKSIGVLKSIDGGLTFNPTGLSIGLSSQKLVHRILIDPTNPLKLFVAASDGIWRTTDGGNTWTNQQAGWFTDLEFKPGDPNYIYASTLSNTGTSQIYRSINNGLVWTQVTALTGINKIDLAVTPGLPNIVSALCVNTSGLGGFYGVYSSNNSGSTYTQVIVGTCTNNMLNRTYDGMACGGQGVFDLAYTIHPSGSSEVWIAGVNNWRTIDAGATWNLNSMYTFNTTLNPNAVTYIHSDKHKIAFHPLNINKLYTLSDGGIHLSTNGGSTWQDLSNGLGITQMYRIGSSATIADKVLCGAQDVGLKLKTGSGWLEVQGGDNMEEIIDPLNDNIQYSETYGGYLYRTLNNWTTNTVISNNIPGFSAYFTANGAGPGAWVTPVVMDPSNNQVLYIGFGNIWKTTDQGNTWGAISNFGLTKPLQSIAIAPSNNQVIYTATYDTLFMTNNGGTTWSYNIIGNITGNPTDKLSYITVNPTNPLALWVTISGFNGGSKVFKSIDGNNTWTNISGTLPNVPVNCCVYENGSSDGIYIGTDLGVFYRDNTLSDWVPYNTGLPCVQVNELDISYVNNKLWAATFGRGLWESNLYSFVGVKETEQKQNYLIISPNPFSNETQIKTSNILKEATLTIYNLYGQHVKQIKNISGQTITLQRDNLTSGLYFIRLTQNNKVISVNKLVITE